MADTSREGQSSDQDELKKEGSDVFLPEKKMLLKDERGVSKTGKLPSLESILNPGKKNRETELDLADQDDKEE